MDCGLEEHNNTNTKQSMVKLNNIGAKLIECGDYGTSIEFLSAAFQYSRKQLSERMESGDVSALKHTPSACAVDIWMVKDHLSSSDESAAASSRHHHQQQQHDVVYTHPMFVPPKASSPSEISVAVAITFNLAVAYHLASIQCCHNNNDQIMTCQGNSKEQLMRQALRLYQYTFRLQRTQARSSQSPFFFMACINNIGILFQELGEFHQSKECFNHLLSLLMYMNTIGGGGSVGGGADNSNTLMNEDDDDDNNVGVVHVDPSRFEFFFLNTTRLAHESCAVGAAAA